MITRRHRGHWALPWAAVAASLLVLVANAVLANTTYHLATDAQFRHVKERDEGETLVREEGVGAGIAVAADWTRGPWRLGAAASWLDSQLSYDGSTQLGAPLATDSDWSEGSLGLNVGRRFEGLMGAYLGARVEYQRRTRNIRSTPEADGLQERYRALWLGLEARMMSIGPTAVDLEFGCAAHSRVAVAFAAELDRASLDLRDHCRAAISAPINIARVGRARFFLRPFVSWERYPKSKPAQLTAQGEPIGRVFLPATEFAAFGIQIGLSTPGARPAR